MSPRCHELEAANTSLDSIVDQLGDVHIEALKAPAHSLADVKHRQLLESSAAPDLPLRIRDLSIPGNAHEVFANTREPFVVDNETCRGRAILKVRTTPEDPHYAPYFEGRSRMFEVMVEGQLKHVTPDDRIYIGLESNSKVELSGFWANATATVVMKLLECTVAHAHVTLGDDENPCQVVFPLDTAVDRLCVTPKGSIPPALGVPMFPAEYARSVRPKHTEYNTEDTYSFSLHSMYVDLVQWRLVNLPGISYMPLDAFLQSKSLRFVAYALPKDYIGPHTAEMKRYVFNFEIDNVNRS